MTRLSFLLKSATFAVVISLLGCSSDKDVIRESEQPVVVPEMFEEDDNSWAKTGGMTESDTQRLSAYFQKNPSVAEHSIVNGDPLVYATDDKRRRYYWVRAGADGAEWFCLEFGDRGVSLKDGHGPPFLGG